MSTAESNAEAQSRHRSPNYPYLDLPAAIEKVRALYKEIGRHPVGIDVLINKLGYTSKSSSGKKALGALRAFGLVDDTKAGRDQLVKLSDRGLDIVADYREGNPEWGVAVREAAQAPKIHSVLLERYKGTLPPDDELRRFLVRVYDPPFTDAGANGFIAEIRSTLAFAGRSRTTVDTSENSNAPEVPPEKVRVGAYVQWTSEGVDQFQMPLRIVGIDGDWAFVEGSPTGIPMQELNIVDPSVRHESKVSPPVNPFFAPPKPGDDVPVGAARAQTKLDEGEAILIWPDDLSKESVADLEYWLEGVVRRARRKAGLADRDDE